MSNIAYIEQAKALYDILLDPSKKGLAGTMALTKLRRVLKRARDVPELAFIKPERLAEFRESNLLASAKIAIDKMNDPERDIKNRLEQFKHAEHYLQKSGCGWQALGLTEQQFIESYFSLLCDVLQQESKDLNYARHYHQDAMDFLGNLRLNDSLSDEEYEVYENRLNVIKEHTEQQIKARFTKSAEQALEAAKSTDLSPTEKYASLEIARMALFECDMSRDRIRQLADEIYEAQRREKTEELKLVYASIVTTMAGNAADEAVEKFERELMNNDLEVKDLGIEEDQFEKQKLIFRRDGVLEHYTEAKKLFAEGDIKNAASKMRSADFAMSYYDVESVGLDVSEIKAFSKLVLKARLKINFENAVGDIENPQSAYRAINNIREELEKNAFNWADIDPALSEEIVAQRQEPLAVAAARSEIKMYIADSRMPFLETAIHFLHAAGKGWEAIEGEERMQLETVMTAKGHTFPAYEAW